MKQEELYPGNPMDFDPDRHLENPSMTSSNFLAFGIGPRSCIGMRLASIMIRAALAQFVLNFKVEPSINTNKNWSFQPKQFGIAANEIVYRIVQRN